MTAKPSIPLIPAIIRLSLCSVPTAVVAFAFEQIVGSIARRHSEMFDRLRGHAGKRFILEPSDLPFVIVLTLGSGAPSVEIIRSRERLCADARIAGPFGALIGLVHGRYDGDALFFAGDLIIEGDVEAVLAFRNAVDNAEIDLLHEGAAVLGPFSGLIEHAVRLTAPFIERHTGVALTRPSSTR